MPRVPDLSPATGEPCPEHYIHTTSANFVDVYGRSILLRGVNLSGSSKAPAGSPSQVLDGFWEEAEGGNTSFMGRPLNLDNGSADVHLSRLKGWGFNMLRYSVTWEALEHEGPGKYDYEFMDYTVRVLRKCKEYGFKIFMDPHQDIWSRFSGGSGAPYWTLVACGINPRNITATQASIIHCEYPVAQNPDPASLPAMLWSTNYGRLAALTIFTFFFAGRDFAPKCIIDGVNIQDYLEHHYFTAFGLLADRIRDAGDLLDSCVIGWDSINEPFEGLCGNPDLVNAETTHGASLKKGTHPTILQSFRLGMGEKQTVENLKFTMFGPQRDGTVTIDPKGRRLWLDPSAEPDGINTRWGWKRGAEWKVGTCIWAQHGVWDIQTCQILNPQYFAYPPTDPGRPVVFVEDYWKAHWQKFVRRIRESHPEAIHFIQPPVFVQPPSLDEADVRGRACYSAHYYDGLTLVTRHWNWFNADALGILRGKYWSVLQAVKIGERTIRKSLQEQLGILKEDTQIIGSYPTILGEIGTPFDMDRKRSYGCTDDGKYLGDYTNQQKALDASLNGADGPNCINWTIWTYCTDNSHEWGDGWNLEDLSIWSECDMLPKSRHHMTHGAYATSATHLLKKESSASGSRPMRSSSMLSLLTLGPHLTDADRLRQEEIPSLSRWGDPLVFLTEGARAVHAFSRPYPIATVGVPINMRFDISQARFELTVRVTPEDRSRRSIPQDQDALKPTQREHSTEIFLPLVHFAAQQLVARSQQREANGEGEYDDHSNSDGGASPISSTSSVSTLVSHSSVDVTVEVSGGRWEVQYQTLQWWYDIPTEGQVEYTISITRADGPIQKKDLRRKSWWSRHCPPSGECSIQ
ncbi:glycoside hydrolase family 5 protein [Ramaria rubella]|nr:glycoside hydrolase family 5 protein [Ramaria rubella]